LNSIYKTSWGLYVDLSRLNAIRLVKFSEPKNYCRLLLYFALTTDPVILETNNILGPVQEDEIVKRWKEHKGEL
jgi:hypothetical protein